jgi:hypothetical protein
MVTISVRRGSFGTVTGMKPTTLGGGILFVGFCFGLGGRNSHAKRERKKNNYPPSRQTAEM